MTTRSYFIVGDKVRLKQEFVVHYLGAALSRLGTVTALDYESRVQRIRVQRDGVKQQRWYLPAAWEFPPDDSDNTGALLLKSATDHLTEAAPKLVYADWLEESGDMLLANAWRWLGRKGKYPGHDKGAGVFKRWTWSVAPIAANALPFCLLVCIPGGGRGRVLFQTLDAAILALAGALQQLRDVLDG